jgi:hypothetical protein
MLTLTVTESFEKNVTVMSFAACSNNVVCFCATLEHIISGKTRHESGRATACRSRRGRKSARTFFFFFFSPIKDFCPKKGGARS